MEERALKELRELAKEGDRDIFSQKMCELLTDDSYQTLGMFESLAYDYTSESASDEFRKGMDSVLTNLLYHNMEEIFEEMKGLNEKAINYQKEFDVSSEFELDEDLEEDAPRL